MDASEVESQQALTLPQSDHAVARAPFPLIASVAPLLAALVIWAITRSPFVLAFAALSPVIAVAGVVDHRWQARRALERERLEHTAARARLRASIGERHRAERAELLTRTPSARAILDAPADDVSRWNGHRAGLSEICAGLGLRPSGVRLDGSASTEKDRELVGLSRRLTGAPIAVGTRNGLGIVGPLHLARAVARGYLVQLCHGSPPGVCMIARVPQDGWEWTAEFPHRGQGDVRPRAVICVLENGTEGDPPARAAVPAGGDADDPFVVTIAIAERVLDLPLECGTVIRLDSYHHAQIARQPDGAAATTARPELITVQQGLNYARRLAEHARSAGIDRVRSLPTTVDLADLVQRDRVVGHAERCTSLNCAIGVTSHGALDIDLVVQGPHAIVGGTTGSGKSELLVAWVTSMASTHSAEAVNFLLVDFKGGSAFAPLAQLPHCVGIVTDLDHGEATRALESLRAELRYRERMLADAGARDIAELPDGHLPRLVIVVDEFAAMIGALDELHALFVDIAARGRSLGVHLILCTQRPSGVVRDALLANCNLRLSLRVNNRSDSEAVIDSAAAANLPATIPGRCVMRASGEEERVTQIATASSGLIGALAARPADGSMQPRRPWLDPLPARIDLADVRDPECDGFVLGIEDVPGEQRQSRAVYSPTEHGHLLVLGAHGSGKSDLAASLVQQHRDGCEARALPADLEHAWDAVMELADEVRSGGYSGGGHTGGGVLLVVDDFDALYERFDPDYRQAVLDALVLVLREGQAIGIHLACMAQRMPGPLASLAALFGASLMLRMPNRQEHILAGGDQATYDATLGAGGGIWHSHRVQLAVSPAPRARDLRPDGEDIPRVRFEPGSRYLLVTTRPLSRMEQLTEALGSDAVVVDLQAPSATLLTPSPGEEAEPLTISSGTTGPQIVVGDADTWQSNWSLLTRLRSSSTIVLEGCTPAEVRAITRLRQLPPPLAPGLGRVWLAAPGDGISRGRLDG